MNLILILIIFNLKILFIFSFLNCLNKQQIYFNMNIIKPLNNICSNNTIIIGVPISYYYKDNYYYQSIQMLNGWKIFLEFINYEKKGILINNQTYFIEFIYIEDYSSINYVQEITDYLIHQYHVNYLFGPYSTPLTIASASISDPNNITLISSGAPLPGVFEQTNYAYGLLPAASTYSEGAFRAFHTLGAKNISVISDTDVSVCNNISSSLYASKYNLTLFKHYDVNITSSNYNQTIKSILQELKDNKVETVFGCSFSTLCEKIITYSKEIDYNPNGIMLSLCIVDPSIRNLGNDLTYVFGLSPWASTSKIYDIYTNWTALDFEKRYESTYGESPTYLSAASFASGEVLIASIENSNSFDNLDIQNQILNNFFPTIYGNISFDQNGQSKNDMFVVQVIPTTKEIELVLPNSYADITPYYPVPTWAKRQCEIDTNYCSNHGTCSPAGKCICDYGYYGYDNVNSCDTYCIGTFDPITGGCAKFTTYYVGILADYQFHEHNEYIAHIQLATLMINNKTDGWFDDILNVHIILNVSDGGCDSTTAQHSIKKLNNWAISLNNGNSLDGLIGSYCSSASGAAASYGNDYGITQISYGSTSESLSDKDLYEYFARTCGSDSTQGPALTNTLINLGITPYIAIIHTEDSYAVSLSNSFSTSYTASDGIILLTLSYNSDTATTSTYDYLIDELAKSGAPAIVLVLYQDQIDKIFEAASTHPILSTNEVVWIGVDAWVDVTSNSNKIPAGTIGLSPNHYNGNITDKYYNVWKNLNSNQFPDSNNNRNDVATYSLQAADALFALAKAYEISLHDNSGLTGMSLRNFIFSSLTNQVSFKGVSGYIDFSASGDLVDPIFRVMRYNGYNNNDNWQDIGTVSADQVQYINYSLIIWPDGTKGNNTLSYSKQLVPYCSAGEEPVVSSDGISTCTPCEVGYYKPNAGRSGCLECPDGADCNDIGIIIPCIMKGYWRAQPNDINDLSNFKKYPIYTCDFSIVCHGGCQLNNSCQDDRLQSSPVCAVCKEGYYMSDGTCYSCNNNQAEDKTIQTLIYISAAIGSLLMLFSIILFMLSFNVASTQSFTSDAPLSESEPSGPPSPSSKSRGSNFRRKSLATLQTMTRSVSKTIFSPAIAMLTHQENQRKVKKVIKGSGMTAKITLSFLQVMTGSFYMLNIDLPNYFKSFFNAIRINPFRPIQASFSCENQSSSYPIHPYFVGTVFCVLIPYAFIILICIAAFLAWRVFLLTKGGKLSKSEKFRQWKRLRDLSIKMYFWFCLISYPPLSQRILSYYNCRDLDSTGVFLRSDYTVSCESLEYQAFFYIAIIGTILVPIGVPVLFSLVVHYRYHPILLNPSLLLHDNFVNEWRYFEAYDLLRKLTLTSLVVYVAPPDTASQCLFLLLVDGTALLLLAYSRPYANGNDDFLSGVLVAVECISFLVATVIVSGIAEQDHYNTITLYNTLFVFILFSMVCIVPWTLGMKFKAISTRIDSLIEKILTKTEDYGLHLPSLTRLDSRRRMQLEVEEMRETMHDIRHSLSDLAQIELMYRDTDDSDDEYHSHEKIKSRSDHHSSNDITLTNQTNTKNPIHRTSLTKSPKDILMKKRDSGNYSNKSLSQYPNKAELDIVRESEENMSNFSSYSTNTLSLNEENGGSEIEIPKRLPSTLPSPITSLPSNQLPQQSQKPPPIPSYPPPSIPFSSSSPPSSSSSSLSSSSIAPTLSEQINITDESKYFEL